MTPEQIIELARDAGSIDSEETIATFANAVIASHTEELLQGVDDAMASIDLCEKCGTAFGSAYYCPKCGHNTCSSEPAYSESQVAAAVAKAEAQRDEYNIKAGMYCMKLEDTEKRIAELEAEVAALKPWATTPAATLGAEAGKRIATLESALKVAQDGLASIHTATACSYSNIQEVLHAAE